jgi:hypothetical protein
MHQGRGVERLSRLFVRELSRGEAAQFVINQREELPRGVGVSRFDCIQDLGDIEHARQLTTPSPQLPLLILCFLSSIASN